MRHRGDTEKDERKEEKDKSEKMNSALARP
jgi:hypothetical protein